MTSRPPPARGAGRHAGPDVGVRPRRGSLLHAFLSSPPLAWLLPLLWAVYTSLRPYAETAPRATCRWPGTLNFDNFINALTQSDMPHYFGNTLIIAVPAVLLTLFLSSFVAFYVAASTSASTCPCCWSSRPATCCRSRSSLRRCTACTCAALPVAQR